MLGNHHMNFNPFEDRTCRDIRNNIGHIFIKAIQAKDAALFTAQVDTYLSQHHPGYIEDYIHHRSNCFDKIFNQLCINTDNTDIFWDICLALWNLKLFFECHEWLEEKWMDASGNEKKAFQALILCAVTYEQLHYNRTIPAKKLGIKAAALMNQYKNQIPPCFHINTMVNALNHMLPAPEFSIHQI